MQDGEAGNEAFCRGLATLAIGIYAGSLLLPAIRPGKGPEYWIGLQCLGALVVTCPMGFLLHPAAWANLTFAAGCYVLHEGRTRLAAGLGAASLALAGSYWVLADNDGPVFSWLLLGYWTWMTAMGVLVVAPAIVAQPRPPIGGSTPSDAPGAASDGGGM